jgi:ATP-dependent DNA helicase
MKEQGISEAMRLEEEQMQQRRQQQQAKRDEEMAQERRKDVEGGEQVVDKKFKALEYLLNQSKVYKSLLYISLVVKC